MFRQVSDHRPLTHSEQGAWDYSRRQFLGHAGISLATAAVATLGAGSLYGSDFSERTGPVDLKEFPISCRVPAA